MLPSTLNARARRICAFCAPGSPAKTCATGLPLASRIAPSLFPANPACQTRDGINSPPATAPGMFMRMYPRAAPDAAPTHVHVCPTRATSGSSLGSAMSALHLQFRKDIPENVIRVRSSRFRSRHIGVFGRRRPTLLVGRRTFACGPCPARARPRSLLEEL